MFVNESGKITQKASYFHNEFTDCYCVIGTTMSAMDIADLEERFESPDLLEEVDMPSYITADYSGAEW